MDLSQCDKYKKGDRVFAKLKGFPVWPALISRREPVKAETYKVYFYGTFDEGLVKAGFLYPYNEENILKYGKSKKTKFEIAMQQIAANLEIRDKEDVNITTTRLGTDLQEQNVLRSEEEGGKLHIDEPVPSTSAIAIKPITTVAKKVSEKPTGKRGGKTVKNLKKLICPSTRANLEPGEILALTPNAKPGSENVTLTPIGSQGHEGSEKLSRSGRKLKPKIFADDLEGSKLRVKNEGSKGRKSNEKATTTTTPSNRAKLGSIAKKDSQELNEQQNEGLIMAQNNTENVPKPGISRPKKYKISKIIPTMEPRVFIAYQIEVDSDGNEIPKEKKPIEIPIEKGDLCNFEVPTGDKKFLYFFDVNSDEIEITFDHENRRKSDFKTRKEESEWDFATSQNVLKIKNDLKNFEFGGEMLKEMSIELKDSFIDNSIYDKELENMLKEKREHFISQLRVEGEVIEIIGEIVQSLSIDEHTVEDFEFKKVLALLEKLARHQITTLMLVKHPVVVQTIAKLRKYTGDPVGWNFSPDMTEFLAQQTKLIREKSCLIWDKFSLLFDSKKKNNFAFFLKRYLSAVEKFKERTKNMARHTVQTLVLDSDGEYFEPEKELGQMRQKYEAENYNCNFITKIITEYRNVPLSPQDNAFPETT